MNPDLPPPHIPPIPTAPAEPAYSAPAMPLTPPAPVVDLAVSGELTPNDKTMGMVSHLLAFAGVLVRFPFANVVGPLVMWVIHKDKSPYIAYHAKESLNFQITLAIAMSICLLLSFILIGIPMLFAVGIYGVVMTIIAAIKANEGVQYRYPYTLRLIK